MALREDKKARTRTALAESALALFVENGFDAVSVDRVAEAADVSRRTFFRYFDSKEAAFFAGQEERLAQFEDMLAATTYEAPYDKVKRCLLELAAVYNAERDRLVAQHRVIEASRSLMAYDLQLDRRWEAAITAALDRGDPLRATVLGGAILGMTRAVLRRWFEGGGRDDLVELGRQAFALLEDGFRIPTGDAVLLAWERPR